MKLNLTRADVLQSLMHYTFKLSTNKKTFVIDVLNKHGIQSAYYALYLSLFVIKDEKELLTFKF